MTTNADITTRVATLPIAQLDYLELNARFMRHETFQRLVTNIRRDGQITQYPFVWRQHNDLDQQPTLDERYLILSGNHRAKAASEAGLTDIPCIICDTYLPPERRTAIQLSHNSIAGEDDPATLKLIYESINSVDERLYSGLDDKVLELLAKVEAPSISEASLKFTSIGIVFLPDEIPEIREAFELAKSTVKHDELWLARWSEYDAFLDSLDIAGQTSGIRNIAAALHIVLSVFRNNLTDLKPYWLHDDGSAKQQRWIPYAAIFGSDALPANVAAKLSKHADRLVSKGELDASARWELLERAVALLDKEIDSE